MKIKNIVTTVSDYKDVAMLVAFPTCTFKCCIEQNIPIETCQNCDLAKEPTVDISVDKILERFDPNIHKALVLGGMEPMDSADDVLELVTEFCKRYNYPVVIYTGYYPEEIAEKLIPLAKLDEMIIIKFGRFRPNRPSRYDPLLGVELASDNQYARILA